ncbi:GTP cyclohydrolase FolE2 [Amphritea japonica]|uniref:GTP cyclohydrolase FolE2 n=1 Tax=Amphritea japonica ATCC BAA-1530 TaxID=1278309 RepID=A0A7R6PDE1_9GAMM|nr:GTP cyclohydrolase FolE2 [Amphritea japonica]BBB27006.1 GTP cyclohydrolase [Amphritea japonica ATCC BAA-1530]
MQNIKPLPDVASQHSASHSLMLQWVGMEGIALPIKLNLADGSPLPVSAQADLYVSLDRPDVKGIHMSRLYLQMNRHLANEPLSLNSVAQLLSFMVESQEGISQSARLNLKFDLLLQRDSLQSNEQGYQSYPVALNAEHHNGRLSIQLELTLPYSSTCPCSASLSRQLYGEAVDRQFAGASIDKQALLQWIQSEAGSIATPHSQRSYAYLKLQLADQTFPELPELIDGFEQALGTPVQTAVKRSDEQEFARLNAENLMFCEDAARRIKTRLEGMEQITDYWFKVEHQESLHAHNAVVIDQKYNRGS